MEPGRKYVCANKIRPAQKRYVYYVESSPKSQLQPILHQQEYAKPGDELRFKVPCIFNVKQGRPSFRLPKSSTASTTYTVRNGKKTGKR